MYDKGNASLVDGNRICLISALGLEKSIDQRKLPRILNSYPNLRIKVFKKMPKSPELRCQRSPLDEIISLQLLPSDRIGYHGYTFTAFNCTNKVAVGTTVAIAVLHTSSAITVQKLQNSAHKQDRPFANQTH